MVPVVVLNANQLLEVSQASVFTVVQRARIGDSEIWPGFCSSCLLNNKRWSAAIRLTASMRPEEP